LSWEADGVSVLAIAVPAKPLPEVPAHDTLRSDWRCHPNRATALGPGSAEAVGADVAERIEWVQGDLATWKPPPGRYDLVACFYVHMAGSVTEMVRRLAAGVAVGGTLLLVGHRPVDPTTGNATAAAGQVQISVDAAVAALDPRDWKILVAEDRPRAAAGTGVDAVVRARRLQ
jgi:hypothetical protein